MARAAAPMFSGFRGLTSTNRQSRLSDFIVWDCTRSERLLSGDRLPVFYSSAGSRLCHVPSRTGLRNKRGRSFRAADLKSGGPRYLSSPFPTERGSSCSAISESSRRVMEGPYAFSSIQSTVLGLPARLRCKNTRGASVGIKSGILWVRVKGSVDGHVTRLSRLEEVEDLGTEE